MSQQDQNPETNAIKSEEIPDIESPVTSNDDIEFLDEIDMFGEEDLDNAPNSIAQQLPISVFGDVKSKEDIEAAIEEITVKIRDSKDPKEKEKYESLRNSLQSAAQTQAVDGLAVDSKDTVESTARGVISDGKKIISGTGKIKLKSSSLGKVDPKNVMKAISGRTGVGSMVRMWSSGFVLRFAPNESDHRDILFELAQVRSSIGKNTGRSSITGYDVYSNEVIYDKLISKITSTNVIDGAKNKDQLAEIIKVGDLGIMFNMALNNIYLKGWPLIHPCVNVSKGKCDYVVPLKRDPKTNRFEFDSLLKFSETERIRRSLVTKKHIEMLNASSLTFDEVKEFQESLDKGDKCIIHIDDEAEVEVHWQHPTVKQYFDDGKRWLSNVESSTNSIMLSLKEADSQKNRSEMLTQRYREQIMGSYLPWVKKVVIKVSGEEVASYDNRDQIMDWLIGLDDEDQEKQFVSDLNFFKSNNIVGFNAILNFKCPKCGANQTDEQEEPENNLIHLNVTNYFFYIAEWMSVALNRR